MEIKIGPVLGMDGPCVWDRNAGEYIPLPSKMRDFLNDIGEVYCKHGLAIGHEDDHGSFLIEDFDPKNEHDLKYLWGWLTEASKNYTG